MEGDKFRNTMHSLNYGTVMEAAARNYIKEKTEEEDKMRAASRVRAMDARDFIEVRRESVEKYSMSIATISFTRGVRFGRRRAMRRGFRAGDFTMR